MKLIGLESLPHACGGVSLKKSPGSRWGLSSPRMWGCFRKVQLKGFMRYVFPTHVGVFLRLCMVITSLYGLPHACGGVSQITITLDKRVGSSPRMWGCFPLGLRDYANLPVFPTHVGVFLWRITSEMLFPGLPHACGGVSSNFRIVQDVLESSPRMWGCFLLYRVHTETTRVFPTHVGVFPVPAPLFRHHRRLPHACGGVSFSGHA